MRALGRVGGLAVALGVGWFAAGWVLYVRAGRGAGHPVAAQRAGVVSDGGGRP